MRKAALVQASTCYGHDNSYVADAVTRYPERFTGVLSCDILSSDAPEMMAHWMAKGLTGLRLFTTGSTMPGQAGWLDDPRTFPAWRKAEEASLPVCLQMTAAGIPQLENVLVRFPGFRVILDHRSLELDLGRGRDSRNFGRCGRRPGPPRLALHRRIHGRAARRAHDRLASQVVKAGAAIQARPLRAPFGLRHAMLRQLGSLRPRPVAMIPASCQKQSGREASAP